MWPNPLCCPDIVGHFSLYSKHNVSKAHNTDPLYWILKQDFEFLKKHLLRNNKLTPTPTTINCFKLNKFRH